MQTIVKWSLTQIVRSPPCRAGTYGDTADECGEPFLLCGTALLELARYHETFTVGYCYFL